MNPSRSVPPCHLLATGALVFALACGGGSGSTPAPPAPIGPSITTAPTAQAGYPGDSVTYRVVAAGSGNTYQWLRNGTAISGATTTAYVLPVQMADDQARYSVRVTASTGGSTTSADAVLDVLYADPAVVAGHDHTLAITTKGRVYAWGVGGNGQLGLADYQPRMVPTAVSLPLPAVQVTAGWGHSLALLSDGRVFAWGNNVNGQLGDGSSAMRNLPAAVPGLTNVVFLASGYNHNFAVKRDGTLWVWGYNASGQLGLQDRSNRTSPVENTLGVPLADISLGSNHSLLVTTSGSLLGCGSHGYGQLGLPSSTGDYLGFTTLTSGVVSARAFNLFSVILASNGLPYGTGENVYGQLGDGSPTTRYGWVQMGTGGLTTGSTLAAVIPGEWHTHLVNIQGQVASTGYNWYGQLGLGTPSTTATLTPQPLSGLTVQGLSAGSQSSYAWLPDLTVKAWGYNANGRLGDGTATDRPAPTTVPGLFLGPLPTGVAPPAHQGPGALGAKARPIYE